MMGVLHCGTVNSFVDFGRSTSKKLEKGAHRVLRQYFGSSLKECKETSSSILGVHLSREGYGHPFLAKTQTSMSLYFFLNLLVRNGLRGSNAIMAIQIMVMQCDKIR